jgi:hypothetical protein
VLQRRGNSLPVVWKGEVNVTGPDEVIKEHAKVDSIVNFVHSRVSLLCIKHHAVIQLKNTEKQ